MSQPRASVEVEAFHYAGLGRRIAALAIDGLLFCLVFFPITRIVKGVWIMTPADHRWSYGWLVTDPLCVTFLAVMVAYFIVSEGLLGATAGKRLVGIRVIAAGGGLPGLWRAVLRNVLRIVDALPVFSILGVVLILTSRQRTRYGDRIAGTRVVDVRQRSAGDN